MLKYMETPASATPDLPIIYGRNVSREPSERRRAEMALEVIEYRAILKGLTEEQIASVFGVSHDYIRGLADSRFGA